jgi:hypothetical protein
MVPVVILRRAHLLRFYRETRPLVTSPSPLRVSQSHASVIPIGTARPRASRSELKPRNSLTGCALDLPDKLYPAGGLWGRCP